jgi:hypothetical protein
MATTTRPPSTHTRSWPSWPRRSRLTWRGCRSAARAGWSLDIDASGVYTQATFCFKSQQGASHSVWGWTEAEKALEQIEAGKVKAEPSRGHEPQKQPCARCQKKVAEREYVEDAWYCKECARLVKQEIQALKRQLIADVQAIVAPWLEQAPPDALRLVIKTMGWQAMEAAGLRTNDPNKVIEQIRAAPLVSLRRGILTQVVNSAYANRRQPVYGAPQQQTLVEAPPPATDASNTWEDGPLANLWRKLTRITGWLDRATNESPTLAAIQGNRENLGQLADALEELADNPDLADEDYEALAQALGHALLRLDGLAEVGAAPQLAEVEA